MKFLELGRCSLPRRFEEGFLKFPELGRCSLPRRFEERFLGIVVL